MPGAVGHLAPGITNVGHTASGHDSRKSLSDKTFLQKKISNKDLRRNIIIVLILSKAKTIKQIYLC